ncbi:hypothetical protein EX30DRAFT_373805 [Ascodesmis nigricans]|uniref:C2H2-type domain-containing protein n=1 Tax=Ascodesmis nigricans TaxID=341454 RepID=A0A4S2MS86_9PEZI|nr:hypothetical protein EX30DRAFT_373805 [Ascodesmis nigricans]
MSSVKCQASLPSDFTVSLLMNGISEQDSKRRLRWEYSAYLDSVIYDEWDNTRCDSTFLLEFLARMRPLLQMHSREYIANHIHTVRGGILENVTCKFWKIFLDDLEAFRGYSPQIQQSESAALENYWQNTLLYAFQNYPDDPTCFPSDHGVEDIIEKIATPARYLFEESGLQSLPVDYIRGVFEEHCLAVSRAEYGSADATAIIKRATLFPKSWDTAKEILYDTLAAARLPDSAGCLIPLVLLIAAVDSTNILRNTGTSFSELGIINSAEFIKSIGAFKHLGKDALGRNALREFLDERFPYNEEFIDSSYCNIGRFHAVRSLLLGSGQVYSYLGNKSLLSEVLEAPSTIDKLDRAHITFIKRAKTPHQEKDRAIMSEGNIAKIQPSTLCRGEADNLLLGYIIRTDAFETLLEELLWNNRNGKIQRFIEHVDKTVNRFDKLAIVWRHEVDLVKEFALHLEAIVHSNSDFDPISPMIDIRLDQLRREQVSASDALMGIMNQDCTPELAHDLEREVIKLRPLYELFSLPLISFPVPNGHLPFAPDPRKELSELMPSLLSNNSLNVETDSSASPASSSTSSRSTNARRKRGPPSGTSIYIPTTAPLGNSPSPKRFARLKDIKKEGSTKTGALYRCDSCNNYLTTHCNLYRHQRTAHAPKKPCPRGCGTLLAERADYVKKHYMKCPVAESQDPMAFFVTNGDQFKSSPSSARITAEDVIDTLITGGQLPREWSTAMEIDTDSDKLINTAGLGDLKFKHFQVPARY